MFMCIHCGARLDLEPCICRHGEDWGNMPEAAEVMLEYMADGGVWR